MPGACFAMQWKTTDQGLQYHSVMNSNTIHNTMVSINMLLQCHDRIYRSDYISILTDSHLDMYSSWLQTWNFITKKICMYWICSSSKTYNIWYIVFNFHHLCKLIKSYILEELCRTYWQYGRNKGEMSWHRSFLSLRVPW